MFIHASIIYASIMDLPGFEEVTRPLAVPHHVQALFLGDLCHRGGLKVLLGGDGDELGRRILPHTTLFYIIPPFLP